jgi:hypothetical protein
MARPRMRPSFSVEAACDADRLRSTIGRLLVLDAEDIEGELSARHGVLRIPEEGRRFWTPCLELTIEELEDDPPVESLGRSKLWGTFSPRAEIWTAFVFTIGTLVILSIFSGVYGIAQLALGRPPFALLVPLGSALVGALLYVSALVGQGLSISDMYRLRAFIDDCLRETETSGSEGIDGPSESPKETPTPADALRFSPAGRVD